jgi:hypothetical protein
MRVRRERVIRRAGSENGSGLPDLGAAPELFGMYPWLGQALERPLEERPDKEA